MNNFCRFTVTLVLGALMVGCQGIPLHEIRKSPPIFSVNSTKSLNTVFICFTTELDEFRGDGRMLVLTYPEESKAEFSIGAMQAGDFKHFYLVSLARSSDGTRTEVQRSPSDYFPLPLTGMIDIAAKCAGTH